MLNYDTTAITIVLVAFFTLAALATLVAVATFGGLLVGHRHAVATRPGRTIDPSGRPTAAPAGRTGKQAPRLA